ncbi:MAG: hypothetical protein N2053_02455, partial [Chitinispirillaceae bacterium]|nr:hypothetical protein [Chitinispirillaceae bacterium]
ISHSFNKKYLWEKNENNLYLPQKENFYQTSFLLNLNIPLTEKLKKTLTGHLYAVKAQRERYPSSDSYVVSEKDILDIEKMFEEVLDYSKKIANESYSEVKRNFEENLDKLHMPVQFRRAETLGVLLEIIENLEISVIEKLKL